MEMCKVTNHSRARGTHPSPSSFSSFNSSIELCSLLTGWDDRVRSVGNGGGSPPALCLLSPPCALLSVPMSHPVFASLHSPRGLSSCLVVAASDDREGPPPPTQIHRAQRRDHWKRRIWEKGSEEEEIGWQRKEEQWMDGIRENEREANWANWTSRATPGFTTYQQRVNWTSRATPRVYHHLPESQRPTRKTNRRSPMVYQRSKSAKRGWGVLNKFPKLDKT